MWKVVTKTTGPSGSNIEVSSPIGLFHVSNKVDILNPEDPQVKNLSMDEILKILEAMFGNQYPSLIASLKKTNSAFDGCTLDGAPLSKDELIKLLNQLQNDAVNVNLNVE